MSHDTALGDDGWRALAAWVPPRSPRLSIRGDLAFVATDDATVGGRVRIVCSGDGVSHGIDLVAPTDEERSEHTPRWSPDGQRLAFVAAGPDLDAVRIVPPGGSACTILAGEGWRVEDLQWIDEECLAAIIAPRGSDSAVALGALRDAPGSGPMVWHSGSGRRRLSTVDLRTGRLEPLDTGPSTVWEACPLDRSRFVAIVSDDPTESGWYGARLSVLAGTGSVHVLYEPGWQIAAPRISPEGTRVAIIEGWASDRGYVAGDVAMVDLVGSCPIAWSIDGVDVTGLEWLDGGQLRFHGWHRTRSAHGVARVDGTVVALDVVDDVLRERTVVHSPDEKISAAVMERAGAPARIVVETDEGGWRPADAPSPDRGGIDLRVDDISWAASDGTEVEGLLLTRRDLDRRRCPPVVAIHGGPANLWTRAASVGAAALASSGYAVILPNPRGSVGRGQAFARANLGDPAGRELDDVLGAVTACREQGLVLDRSPGVVGGSYGGYLTAAAAVFRDVAAAVVMYGHPDLISARFGSNNPGFYDILLGGPPGDETLPLYIERSPVLHVHGGVAPTLILHGDGDRCTPVGQADELFRALLDHDVPSELVVYPGEGHGLRSPAAQLDAWARTIAWFDRHVNDEGPC